MATNSHYKLTIKPGRSFSSIEIEPPLPSSAHDRAVKYVRGNFAAFGPDRLLQSGFSIESLTRTANDIGHAAETYTRGLGNIATFEIVTDLVPRQASK